jgi:hypothetical protein
MFGIEMFGIGILGIEIDVMFGIEIMFEIGQVDFVCYPFLEYCHELLALK